MNRSFATGLVLGSILLAWTPACGSAEPDASEPEEVSERERDDHGLPVHLEGPSRGPGGGDDAGAAEDAGAADAARDDADAAAEAGATAPTTLNGVPVCNFERALVLTGSCRLEEWQYWTGSVTKVFHTSSATAAIVLQGPRSR